MKGLFVFVLAIGAATVARASELPMSILKEGFYEPSEVDGFKFCQQNLTRAYMDHESGPRIYQWNLCKHLEFFCTDAPDSCLANSGRFEARALSESSYEIHDKRTNQRIVYTPVKDTRPWIEAELTCDSGLSGKFESDPLGSYFGKGTISYSRFSPSTAFAVIHLNSDSDRTGAFMMDIGKDRNHAGDHDNSGIWFSAHGNSGQAYLSWAKAEEGQPRSVLIKTSTFSFEEATNCKIRLRK